MYAAGCGRLVLVVDGVPAGGTTNVRNTVWLSRCRAAGGPGRGTFEHRCPLGGKGVRWLTVGEDAPLRRAASTRQVRRKGTGAGLGFDAVGGSVVALPTTNVYGPGMPGIRRTPGWRPSSARPWKMVSVPGVYEDGGQMRDFVHVDDVAAANVAATTYDHGGFTAFNVCSGHPIAIREVAEQLCVARSAPPPKVTGQYRSGDVRHIVADVCATQELGFTAGIHPRDGLRDFAFCATAGLNRPLSRSASSCNISSRKPLVLAAFKCGRSLRRVAW